MAETLRDHAIGMNRDNYVNLCREMALRLEIASPSFKRPLFMATCEATDGAPRR